MVGRTLKVMPDEALPNWLEPKPAQPLGGDESFIGTPLSVADFWRWGFSDLRENITRGILAEFLVAQAVGDPSRLRHAWDNFDVTTPEGIRVEVKSSAYLQSWRQRNHSRIAFSGLTGREYSYEQNTLAAEPTLRADVYVFAVHTCKEPDQYDALDTDSWAFYVASVELLRQLGSPKSVSLAQLEAAGIPPRSYADLTKAIKSAWQPHSSGSGATES